MRLIPFTCSELNYISYLYIQKPIIWILRKAHHFPTAHYFPAVYRNTTTLHYISRFRLYAGFFIFMWHNWDEANSTNNF